MDTTTRMGGGNGRGMLVGRYELRGLVGQGGMADVELAMDTVLDRQIAVKILHARYADDPSFLARFRREAQAAASLNHPNIVAVYDTGEDDGRPFIVMEYVAGESLRDLIRHEQLLPHRAVEIIGDAALGLHYAHERGLVHRDIKPGNILISEEGQVKVADFGIARAVNAESVTQTAAVFGTAAYVAPEQAQGEPVDRRTDVYALGCVLYELLTGRQPFAAESAVALAYKHVSENPIPPSRVNPEIGPQLEAVVLKAMAKDPADRYQTARDFQTDLSRAMQGLAVAAPSAAAYATTRALGYQDAEPTLLATSPAPTRRTVPVDDFEEDQPERRGPGAGAFVLGLLILAILVVAGYLLVNLASGNDDPEVEQVAVPEVRGRPIAEAETLLRDAGLNPVRGDGEESDQPVDTVISTNPPIGASVDQGSDIRYNFSTGPAPVAIPSVAGQTVEEATATLQAANLTVAGQVDEASDEFDPGDVIRSDPPEGQQVAPGSGVTLVVSTGPAALSLPNVVGLPEQEARAQLENFCGTPICVSVDVEEQASSEVGEGRVIAQIPDPGTPVERGDGPIVIVVSTGPEPEPPSPSPSEPSSPSPSPSPTASPDPTEDPTDEDEDED